MEYLPLLVRSPMKPRLHVPSPLPQPHDLVSAATAVAILREYCRPEHEDPRAYANKVRQLLQRALKKNELPTNCDGQVVFGHLIAWGLTKRQFSQGLERFQSIPYETHDAPADTDEQPPPTKLPASLAECQLQLIVLERELRALRKKLRDLTPYIETGRKLRKPKKLRIL